jgi:hypothetical protein
MAKRFQVGARTLLVTTALVAVWFGMVVVSEAEWLQSNPITGGGSILQIPFAVVMTTLPSAAVGTLFGRPGLGVLCGLVTLAAWTLQWFYHSIMAA